MAIRFTGKVERLNPTEDKTNIRLRITPAQQPRENYFWLMQDHPNYQALYSLALAAAINGYDLHIRTTEDVSPGEVARVLYMVVEW